MDLYEKIEAKDPALRLELIIDGAQFYSQYGRKYSDVLKETKSGISVKTGESLTRKQMVKNLCQLLQHNHKKAADEWFFNRVNALPPHQRNTVRSYYAKPFKPNKRSKTRLKKYLTDNWESLRKYPYYKIYWQLEEKNLLQADEMKDIDSFRKFCHRLGLKKRT